MITREELRHIWKRTAESHGFRVPKSGFSALRRDGVCDTKLKGTLRYNGSMTTTGLIYVKPITRCVRLLMSDYPAMDSSVLALSTESWGIEAQHITSVEDLGFMLGRVIRDLTIFELAAQSPQSLMAHCLETRCVKGTARDILLSIIAYACGFRESCLAAFAGRSHSPIESAFQRSMNDAETLRALDRIIDDWTS